LMYARIRFITRVFARMMRCQLPAQLPAEEDSSR
jgi:hypothetical protein